MTPRNTILLLALFTLPIATTGRIFAGDERTREFPNEKCKFTLPTYDWKWVENSGLNALCVATDSKGYVITVSAVLGKGQMDESFATDCERLFFRPGEHDKRSGRMLTFHSLPCYQSEGILADKRTTATRFLMANGYGYIISLIGTDEPIEKSPAFESIMKGFDFTTPPVVAPVENKAANLSQSMGKIAAYCLMGALALFILRKLTLPKARPAPLNDPSTGPFQARRVQPDHYEDDRKDEAK